MRAATPKPIRPGPHSAPRATYVPDGFPNLSESFVINEIWLLERRGYRIAVEPLRSGNADPAVHDRLRELLPRICVGRPGSRPAAGALPLALRHASQYWPGRRPRALLEQAQNAWRVAELVRRIEASRPDVIVDHFAFDNAVASRIAAARLGVPLVLWMHGSDFYSHPHRHLRWITRGCATAVVATPYGEAELRRLGVECPILCSNMGVDLERFSPGEPSERELRPTLICIARLGHNKNHERLFRVFATVRRQLSDAVLWLVGTGPKRAALERLADELGLKDAVRFLGAVGMERMPGLLRRAWLEVLLSDREGLGVVLMEAAACGLPAVASRVGGIPEAVADGETGLLCAFDAPESEAIAAERIVGLLRDETLRAEMGRAARERAELLFDERAHAARLDQRIRSLLR